MQESVRGMITRHEGNRLRRYLCPAGHWTIGRGWNIDAWPLPRDIAAYEHVNGEITQEMSDILLDITVDTVMRQAQDIFNDFNAISETRRNALIDLIVNMGTGRLVHSFPSFVNAVNRRDWQRAADELKYVNGVTKKIISKYWQQLHGDPDGQDDGRESRPEEIYRLLVDG